MNVKTLVILTTLVLVWLTLVIVSVKYGHGGMVRWLCGI